MRLVLLLALLFTSGCSAEDYVKVLGSLNQGSGQEGGLLLVSEGKGLLFDVGRYDSKEALLREVSDVKIKAIIISHSHDDHFGSLSYLYKYLSPKPTVYYNAPNKALCDAEPDSWGCNYEDIEKGFKGVPTVAIKEGDFLTLGNLNLNVLAASYSGSKDINDESVIIKVTSNKSNTSLLLTGDANARVGQYVEDKYDLSADILQLPHHGCKGQPSDSFYKEVNPVITIWNQSKHFYNTLTQCEHTKQLVAHTTQIHNWQGSYVIEFIPITWLPPVLTLILND